MPDALRDSPNPFNEYHRARRRSVIGRVAAIGIPLAVLFVGLFVVSTVAPAQAESASSDMLPAISAGPAATSIPSVTQAPSTTQPTTPAPAVAGVQSVIHIAITATGYQQELDACQWVRMDLGTQAPIVGAHTRCGGSVVLAMHPGNLVDLQGQGFEGTYVVTDARDAHSGDDASLATAGMQAQVILQTCYPGAGGRERLIGLELQS